MFECARCHGIFEDPTYRRFSECVDGENWRSYDEAFCPHCGGDEFREVEEPEEEA